MGWGGGDGGGFVPVSRAVGLVSGSDLAYTAE